MTDAAVHLFVYGTLRASAQGTMHRLLAHHSAPAVPAWMPGRLYHAGHYPAAIWDPASPARVAGELYAMGAAQAEALFEVLDEYEGYDAAAPPGASLFVRRRVPVTTDGGAVRQAWAYLYDRPVTGLPPITSGEFGPSRG